MIADHGSEVNVTVPDRNMDAQQAMLVQQAKMLGEKMLQGFRTPPPHSLTLILRRFESPIR